MSKRPQASNEANLERFEELWQGTLARSPERENNPLLNEFISEQRAIAQRIARIIESDLANFDERFTAALEGIWEAAKVHDPAQGITITTRITVCARSRVMDLLKKETRKRKRVVSSVAVTEDRIAAEQNRLRSNTADSIHEKRKAMLVAAYRKLPPSRRKTFLAMHYGLGRYKKPMNQREIAAKYRMTTTGVRSSIHKAKKHLFQILEKQLQKQGDPNTVAREVA